MSKRQQQKKIKEQKQAAAKQRDRAKKIGLKVFTFVITPVLLLFMFYTLFTQGPTYSPVEISDSDHIRGTTENSVTIVVYADFQCPACATEHQTMTQLWPSIRDRALLIFRHYPITAQHPNSWTASLYAEAAARQNRFWEMHDYLFATQPIWSSMNNVEGEFDSYALELNLDIDQLHEDIESEEVISKIRNDQRGGNSAGVRSTPAVFINGGLLANPSRTRIIEAVNEEYEAASD